MDPEIRADKLTTNPSLAKKLWKKSTAKKTGMCSRCKPHRGENHKNHDQPRRSWKSKRKTKFKPL